MKHILLQNGWKISTEGLLQKFTGTKGIEKQVILPYDAMIYEKTDKNAHGKAQTGFYPGGEYVYEKELDVPEEWKEKEICLFFGGVYQTAQVMINGDFAGANLYGYGEFLVDISPFLNFGKRNTIKVIAKNTAQPNSRWYTGTGIYRNVELLLGGEVFIPQNGLHVVTKQADKSGALVEIETKVKNISRQRHKIILNTSVTGQENLVAEDQIKVTVYPGDTETLRQSIYIPDALLWDAEHPNLYDIKVSVMENGTILDTENVKTGFRTFSVDAKRGLIVNGKKVKLRGACIHHDNGILGAATFKAAEKKRVEELKQAGFNAVRSAHHPMGRDMLEACDEVGLYVMDELSDVWHEQKNTCDISQYFDRIWEEEIEKMVAKDFSHPSVIMYSIGNEILDIGHESGGRISRKICDKFHQLDAGRYTTIGASGINAIAAAGRFSVMIQSLAEEKRQKEKIAHSDEPEGVGALNQALSTLTGEELSCNKMMTEILEEPCQACDICGYNYFTERHEMEGKLHPNKPLVATETYPADVARIWNTVKMNEHVLGEFTWAGYDYIGEAGCGILYYDGKTNFSGSYPDRLAYIGDININGYRRPISYLREVVYELRTKPYIAVIRVNRFGQEHSETAWVKKDLVSSWTWPGYEGKPTQIDVFSPDDEVELYLNDELIERKECGPAVGYVATFDIVYQPGRLKAVGYKDGRKTEEYEIKTAGEEIILHAEADRTYIRPDLQEIAFITCTLVDKNNVHNLFARKEITVKVDGEAMLQGFGSADPQPLRSYQDSTWETFDGQVMAAVRSNGKSGKIKVTFMAEGCENVETVIYAEEI